MITIEVRDTEVKAAFAHLQRAGTDPRPALAAIGGLLTSSTQLRFRDGAGPSGAAWAPLSPVTLARRRKQGRGAKPLLDTGRLQNSIHYQVLGNAVVVGTDAVYGALQHFGASKGQFGKTRRGAPIPWGNVPPRPFLGLSRADRDGVLGVLARHVVPQ